MNQIRDYGYICVTTNGEQSDQSI